VCGGRGGGGGGQVVVEVGEDNYCTLETVHRVSFVVHHRIATKRYEDEKERQKKQAESIAKVKTTLKERGAAAEGGAPMEAGFYEDDQDRRKRWVHCAWPINGRDIGLFAWVMHCMMQRQQHVTIMPCVDVMWCTYRGKRRMPTAFGRD
jgi:hypothetical protein